MKIKAVGIVAAIQFLTPAICWAGFDPAIHDSYCNNLGRWASKDEAFADTVRISLISWAQNGMKIGGITSPPTYDGGIASGRPSPEGLPCGGPDYNLHWYFPGEPPYSRTGPTVIFMDRHNPYIPPPATCSGNQFYNSISRQCETQPVPPQFTSVPAPIPTPPPLAVDVYKAAGCNLLNGAANPGQAGNPVNAGFGNKCQIENGFGYQTPIPNFNFFYNSYNNLSSGQPAGWTFRYGTRVVASADLSSADAYRADGKILHFVKNTAGTWAASSDIVESLTSITDGSGTLSGWIYKTLADEVETYSADGHLQKLALPNGIEYVITHWLNTARILDNQGHWLIVAFNSQGHPTNTWSMLWGGSSSFDWDEKGNLTTIRYGNDSTKQFLYEDRRFPNALTGIVDENGSRYATWSYDDKGRAISSEHAGGVEKVTFEYSGTGTTKVTDAAGGVATWSFSSVQNVALLTSKPAPCTGTCQTSPAQTYKYDGDGNLTEMADYRGNKTTYKYDTARRLQIERAEAVGTVEARTITTRWHASFRLPTKITEPNRVTDFTYDARGNLTQKVITAGTSSRTWKWTYNAFGQVLKATDPANQTTDYSYAGDGTLLEIKNALGQTITYGDYSPEGWPGKRTDANGVITSLTYTPRGWLKTSTTDGKLTQFDYDKVGQLSRVTFPDGHAISYSYDAAHRLTDIADSLGNKIHYTLDLMGNKLKEEITDPSGALAVAMKAVNQTRQSPLPNPAEAV